MAKKKINQPSTTQIVVVIMLALSVIFNLVTFKMLLDESHARVTNEEIIEHVLKDHALRINGLDACVDAGTSPCNLQGYDAKKNK